MVISDTETIEKSLVRCFSRTIAMFEISGSYGIDRVTHVIRLTVCVCVWIHFSPLVIDVYTCSSFVPCEILDFFAHLEPYAFHHLARLSKF